VRKNTSSKEPGIIDDDNKNSADVKKSFIPYHNFHENMNYVSNPFTLFCVFSITKVEL